MAAWTYEKPAWEFDYCENSALGPVCFSKTVSPHIGRRKCLQEVFHGCGLQMETNVHLLVLAAGRCTLVFFRHTNVPSRFSCSGVSAPPELNETNAFAGRRSRAADD